MQAVGVAGLQRQRALTAQLGIEMPSGSAMTKARFDKRGGRAGIRTGWFCR
jgi:hypothetical protein